MWFISKIRRIIKTSGPSPFLVEGIAQKYKTNSKI